MFAGCQKMFDFAKEPRAPLRGTANHDRVRTGYGQYVARFFGRGDVAVGHHRNAHGRFDGGNGLVFRVALVEIGALAAVHGQHGNARVLRNARNIQRFFVLAIPTRADLQRDGHRVRANADCIHQCLHDLRDQSRVSFCSNADPAATLQTFLAGQPMLMSIICAPFATL